MICKNDHSKDTGVLVAIFQRQGNDFIKVQFMTNEKGQTSIDIRQWFLTDKGEFPTKFGIRLTVSEVKDIITRLVKLAEGKKLSIKT